ncbi:MAG: hypothetical protein ABI333_15370 [bacterium]
MQNEVERLPGHACVVLVAVLTGLWGVQSACTKRKAPPREDPDLAARNMPAAGRPRPRPRPGASRAVGLFLAWNRAGRRSLFQLSPRGGEPTSVLGTDRQSVRWAAVADSGTAVALLGKREDGRNELRRALLGPTLDVRGVGVDAARIQRVRAISSDGGVIAVELVSGELAVVRVRAGGSSLTSVGARAFGRPMYGVALSPDGSKLAFAVMKTSCASGARLMATCPVSLYGVDLRAASPQPHAIVTGADAVHYDPQFVTPDGRELIYQTNAGDRSEPCRKHVNGCVYSIHRIGFRGGRSRVVARDGVLGRLAPDGTLVHRRRTLRGAARSWDHQTLVIAPPGKTPVVAFAGAVRNRVHFVSPDGDLILVQTTRHGRPSLDLVGRDGKRLRPGIPGDQVRAMGWSVRALPPGPARVRAPAAVRRLVEAAQIARSHVGLQGQLGVLGVDAAAANQAELRGAAFQSHTALGAWLQGGKGRAGIVGRAELCVRRRTAAGHAARWQVVGTVDNEVVVVTAPAARRPPAPQAGKPLATFDARPNGGALELVGFVLPRLVMNGARFTMELQWRVIVPPPTVWKVFVHVDGRAMRVLGDHWADLCGALGGPLGWRQGDVIRDRFDVTAANLYGRASPGRHTVYVGWFSGNRRAKLTAPERSFGDRYRVGTIEILPSGSRSGQPK